MNLQEKSDFLHQLINDHLSAIAKEAISEDITVLEFTTLLYMQIISRAYGIFPELIPNLDNMYHVSRDVGLSTHMFKSDSELH